MTWLCRDGYGWTMLVRLPSTTNLTVRKRTARAPLRADAREIHERCGIYTRPQVARQILDAVGWRPAAHLFKLQLLEPAAGDGAFVVEAARRLIMSCRRFDLTPTASTISKCIRAYEIHGPAARRCRLKVVTVLRELDVHPRTAAVLARTWVVHGDFLSTTLPTDAFTHAVGNPPYIRWSKIPENLRKRYEASLPRVMTGGDLFLPFLDRSLEYLQPGGTCGFLCSDRWRFMAFAEAFRAKWLPRLDIIAEDTLLAATAFTQNVDTYPTILIAKKITPKSPLRIRTRSALKTTLAEAGYIVRVGPALGHTPAYLLRPEEHDVEAKLLVPWVDGSEIFEGKIIWSGRRVICMYGEDGLLRDLAKFPKLAARLARHSKALKQRSIVLNGAPWFRPIDRVRASDWSRPKLLVPELAKIPRLALDLNGRIPSHGVYAIFAPDDNLAELSERLAEGRLATALENIAPKVKGGFTRCYKRFLEKIVLD
jgi:adenine-specific DNA-methyltransferase